MKPIVKRAGGKTQILNELLPLPEFNTYYEVFFGGGALYFYVKPKKAVINDFNGQLMNLYQIIKTCPDELIERLNELQNKHSEKFYYEVRDKYNECLKKDELSVESASYLLYLNKMGFNGLYRLNSKGLFNVPSAHKTKCKLYDIDNLSEVCKQLENTEILCMDFEEACKNIKVGDFVFFDSPYYNTFTNYQAGGFNDHERLCELFKQLTKKGVKCLLTNSNEEYIKELYKDFNIKVIKVKRRINCDGSKRSGEEIIVRNYWSNSDRKKSTSL